MANTQKTASDSCTKGHKYVEGSYSVRKTKKGGLTKECKICRRIREGKTPRGANNRTYAKVTGTSASRISTTLYSKDCLTLAEFKRVRGY